MEVTPYEGIATVTLHLMWNASLKINKAEEAFLACLRKISPGQAINPARGEPFVTALCHRYAFGDAVNFQRHAP
jgi:hypothetical protein